MKNWSPQERLFVSMRNSTEPDFFAILAIIKTEIDKFPYQEPGF
jgi:hypothetical protein